MLKKITKAIKSPFKMLVVLMSIKDERSYQAFCEVAREKHFYTWQWKLLDKIYKRQ